MNQQLRWKFLQTWVNHRISWKNSKVVKVWKMKKKSEVWVIFVVKVAQISNKNYRKLEIFLIKNFSSWCFHRNPLCSENFASTKFVFRHEFSATLANVAWNFLCCINVCRQIIYNASKIQAISVQVFFEVLKFPLPYWMIFQLLGNALTKQNCSLYQYFHHHYFRPTSNIFYILDTLTVDLSFVHNSRWLR